MREGVKSVLPVISAHAAFSHAPKESICSVNYVREELVLLGGNNTALSSSRSSPTQAGTQQNPSLSDKIETHPLSCECAILQIIDI